MSQITRYKVIFVSQHRESELCRDKCYPLAAGVSTVLGARLSILYCDIDDYLRKWALLNRLLFRIQLINPFSRVVLNLKIEIRSKIDPLCINLVFFSKIIFLSAKDLKQIEKSTGAEVRNVFYFGDPVRNRFNYTRNTFDALTVSSLIISYPHPGNEDAFRQARKVNTSLNFVVINKVVPIRCTSNKKKLSPSNLGGTLFFGTFEASRAELIRKLCKAGFQITLIGNGWNKFVCENLIHLGGPVYGNTLEVESSRSLCVLNFYRELQGDLLNSRVVEIPSNGGIGITFCTNNLHYGVSLGLTATNFTDFKELINMIENMSMERHREMRTLYTNNVLAEFSVEKAVDLIREAIEKVG